MLENGRCKGCGEKLSGWEALLSNFRQDLFNPNLDDTLLAEYQIECFCVKVYLCPRFFVGDQFIDVRDQVGSSVNLGISWDGSTRYLDIHLPTREDINRLGSLQLT